jgi:hypothetical protein
LVPTIASFQKKIQDCILALIASLFATMGLTWLVWFFMSCFLLSSPVLLSNKWNFGLMIFLPMSIVVGFLLGIGEMDNNSGKFSLLLVAWWCSFFSLSLFYNGYMYRSTVIFTLSYTASYFIPTRSWCLNPGLW